VKQILFVCVHNAGRSQMAAGFLNASGSTTLTAESAGTIPTEHVNPVVVEAMREKNIDIGGSHPKILTQAMADAAYQVITMGCSIDEACPATFMLTEDWGLDDPAGQPIDEVRRIRDQIESKVKALLEQEG
jgi:arsenate reductase